MRLARDLFLAWFALPMVAFGAALNSDPLPIGSTPQLTQLLIVAPAKPGSGWDELARAMRRALRASGLARQIEIRNIPGARGVNGLVQFANSYRGSGDVLLVGGVTMVRAAQADGAAASLEEVAPLAQLTSEFEVIAVPAGSDLQSAQGLVNALGAKPRLLPHVTISALEEQGVDASLANWRGVFAPPGLSAQQLAALSDLVDHLVESEAWKAELVRHHWSGQYLRGGAFVRLVRSGHADSGIAAQDRRSAETEALSWRWVTQIWMLRNVNLLVTLLLGLAALAAFFLCWQRIGAARREAALTHEIDVAKRHAQLMGAEAEGLLRGLSDQIERQFEHWELTAAEHEVALLLLKGFRHKEIAGIRGTSERTVRQQAIAIYKKAGIEGRTDLAAFFLEDLLSPSASGSHPDPMLPMAAKQPASRSI